MGVAAGRQRTRAGLCLHFAQVHTVARLQEMDAIYGICKSYNRLANDRVS